MHLVKSGLSLISGEVNKKPWTNIRAISLGDVGLEWKSQASSSHIRRDSFTFLPFIPSEEPIMLIRKTLLPVFLCPFLALAAPEPNPAPAPVAAPESTPSGGLLNELPQILDGVKELLSQDTLDNLDTIIGGGATLLSGDTPKSLKKLLSSNNIDKLQDVIDNAHGLLKPSFVNETTTLIDEATPVRFLVCLFVHGRSLADCF